MSEPWLSLTEHLDRAADDGDFSGTVLVTAGEETLLHACHGIANRAAGVPVMRRTRFGVASLSKMFTAVAVLAALDIMTGTQTTSAAITRAVSRGIAI